MLRERRPHTFSVVFPEPCAALDVREEERRRDTDPARGRPVVGRWSDRIHRATPRRLERPPVVGRKHSRDGSRATAVRPATRGAT